MIRYKNKYVFFVNFGVTATWGEIQPYISVVNIVIFIDNINNLLVYVLK